MSEETTMTTETIKKISLTALREAAAKALSFGSSPQVSHEDLLPLVEAVEVAQATLAAIDRALAAHEPGSDTHLRLQFCVGATLDLREHLDRFEVPGHAGETRGYYRKRTVVIEAMQYPGLRELADARLVLDWLDEHGVTHRHDHGLVIQTLEGDMTASPGDWIIRGVQGEFYPCKPDIFEQTYEAVDGV